jgi:hypothetical protein
MLPRAHLFLRIQEGVDYFDNRESVTELQDRLAHQSKNFDNGQTI